MSRPPAAAGGEVRWHRELPSPAHLGSDRMEARDGTDARRASSAITSATRVRLAGWLHHQRQLAQVTFLLLRDGAGIAQVVVVDADARASGAGAPAGVGARGRGPWSWPASRRPAASSCATRRSACSSSRRSPPPFELRRPELNAQLPTLLDHAAVALRHPRAARPFAPIAAASVAGFRATLDARGFTEIHTPKIVGRGDRERRQRVPGRLVRPHAPTSPRARSSTSR